MGVVQSDVCSCEELREARDGFLEVGGLNELGDGDGEAALPSLEQLSFHYCDGGFRRDFSKGLFHEDGFAMGPFFRCVNEANEVEDFFETGHGCQEGFSSLAGEGGQLMLGGGEGILGYVACGEDVEDFRE